MRELQQSFLAKREKSARKGGKSNFNFLKIISSCSLFFFQRNIAFASAQCERVRSVLLFKTNLFQRYYFNIIHCGVVIVSLKYTTCRSLARVDDFTDCVAFSKTQRIGRLS